MLQNRCMTSKVDKQSGRTSRAATGSLGALLLGMTFHCASPSHSAFMEEKATLGFKGRVARDKDFLTGYTFTVAGKGVLVHACFPCAGRIFSYRHRKHVSRRTEKFFLPRFVWARWERAGQSSRARQAQDGRESSVVILGVRSLAFPFAFVHFLCTFSSSNL